MSSPLLEPLHIRRGVVSPLDRARSFKGEPRTLSPLFNKVATFSTTPIARCDASVASAESPKILESSDTSKKCSPVLQLVPKCVAKLASLGKNGEGLVQMADPQPNWTLDDLKKELDALGGNLESTQLHKDQHNDRGWSWKADVADFNRDSKPFVMRAYDTDEEDDESNKENEDSESFTSDEGSEESMDFRQRDLISSSTERITLVRTGRIEAGLLEADRARVLKVQEELRQRRSLLGTALLEASQRSAARLEQVTKEEESKRDIMRRVDTQHQRSVAEQRDKYLLALQRDHEQRSQVEVQKIRKEEETARRKELAAREEMERQMKARAEAEAKKAAEKSAEAERERKQRADAAEVSAKAALQRAEAERKKIEENAKQLAVAQGPKAKASASAVEAETRRKQILSQIDGSFQDLLSKPVSKKDLKQSEYQLSKYIVQVSATADHVRGISGNILQLLRCEAPKQQFVVSKIASKLLSQCEEQILKVPSFAYVLAQIAVTVSNSVPVVMDAVLARLHTVCILTVPKFYMYHKTDFKDERDYFKCIGYAEEAGKLETTDDYISRMRTYIVLYAAIIQTEGPNSYGIGNGWRWVSQVLNHLPANRYTGSALYAFLETAGYALYRTYGRAFIKLVVTIREKFLPIIEKNDPDLAVLNRFDTYIRSRAYERNPEGRVLR